MKVERVMWVVKDKKNGYFFGKAGIGMTKSLANAFVMSSKKGASVYCGRSEKPVKVRVTIEEL